jgi:hypothetical protein
MLSVRGFPAKWITDCYSPMRRLVPPSMCSQSAAEQVALPESGLLIPQLLDMRPTHNLLTFSTDN